MREDLDFELFHIDSNFSCLKHDYPNRVNCKDCKYYYLNEDRLSRCLKLDVRNWVTYRVMEGDNE